MSYNVEFNLSQFKLNKFWTQIQIKADLNTKSLRAPMKDLKTLDLFFPPWCQLLELIANLLLININCEDISVFTKVLKWKIQNIFRTMNRGSFMLLKLWKEYNVLACGARPKSCHTRENFVDCVQRTWDLVVFQIIVEATYMHQNSDRKVTRQPDSHSICYQPAVEAVVCDNTADNCQKLAKLANQLLCAYAEIRISYLHL